MFSLISCLQKFGPRLALTATLVCLATGCGAINSNLQIEPGNQFVLGGGSRGAFVVDAHNVGPTTVTISQRAISGQDTSVGTLAPGQTSQLRFPAGTAAVLQNDSSDTARLQLKIQGDTALGMRYEAKP